MASQKPEFSVCPSCAAFGICFCTFVNAVEYYACTCCDNQFIIVSNSSVKLYLNSFNIQFPNRTYYDYFNVGSIDAEEGE